MTHATAPARGNAARTNNAQARSNATHANTTASTASAGTHNNNTSVYGSGTHARQYRSVGYGRGSRNRSYGRRSGYGRSQGSNRAMVSRLRSVHNSLARLDHDYKGHRVKAMHSISMAIRTLSHRSMVYSGSGFSSVGNNGLNNRSRLGGVNAGVRRNHPLSQAQSDARMNQAMRTTQGIYRQLSNQGNYTTSHSRARGHVQRAVNEMGIALTKR